MKRLAALLLTLVVLAGCDSAGGVPNPCPGGLVRDGTIRQAAECEEEQQQAADRAKFEEYLRESQEAQEREWLRQDEELDEMMEDYYFGPP